MAANYYWGMWGAATTNTTAATYPAPASAAEPSWEEQAFARDAAGHLGVGCVWPPRSYTCTFCRREFRSAQALGGHMNVHRRDRARLRQCASPPDHQVQPQPTSPYDHHEHLQPGMQYRAAVRPKSPQDQQASMIGSSTSSPSYISSIIKENRNKVFIAIPAEEASESGDEEERRKRRRVDQPPAVALPFFVRRSPASCERERMQGADDGDTKVPKAAPSPSPLLLAVGLQEVDLELRLGTSS
ncbi:putative transcriptional regulator RABBIT EARS [Hordeum vulgare]|uniref:C2H2-type domain-containing protein n=1 Tax=Hordeum vulgare subsp. vulgare TaxID=112509 RepID=A0A8I7B603_HORVV|nr:uncharacterized protein LOC123430141 [Hordeum vulgare subsp. vulgare]KAE8808049.1 putative transcriptional regulator RABBIT EARS [Hordeum vulgare]